MERFFSISALGIVAGSLLFLTSMFLLQRKRKSFWFHVGLWFVILVYFQIYEFAMYFHGEKLWFVMGIAEITLLTMVIILNNEGNFWRNYCMLVLGQSCASIIDSLLVFPFPALRKYMAAIVSYTPVTPWIAALLLFGGFSIAFLLTLFLLKRLFRKEYRGDGTIYRNIMIGYTVISYILLASRWKLIARIRQGDVSRQSIVMLCLVWVICLVVLCNYVPYVYNRSELKWQKKEQKLFLQLLAESRSHYESLVELPIMVGQPLSGKITLDAVISEYARKAKTQGILFDMLVKPLAQTQIAELDLAVIADYLLQQAFSNVKNGEDALYV